MTRRYQQSCCVDATPTPYTGIQLSLSVKPMSIGFVESPGSEVTIQEAPPITIEQHEDTELLAKNITCKVTRVRPVPEISWEISKSERLSKPHYFSRLNYKYSIFVPLFVITRWRNCPQHYIPARHSHIHYGGTLRCRLNHTIRPQGKLTYVRTRDGGGLSFL